jgi:hypothetical protein
MWRMLLQRRNNNIMLKFILFFLLIIYGHQCVSQQLDDAICISGGKRELDYRKKPWKGNNQFLHNYLVKIDYFANKDKVRYLVPIKFWVYRSNNKTGGASMTDIKNFMTDLNHYNSINQTGIQFYIREIAYVNKTSRQVVGYTMEAPLQTIFRHTKPALNVYLVENFKKKQESKRMVKGTFNIVTKSVIIQCQNSNTSLSHEIGHFFGLLHPHRHYNMGKSKQEPVSRERSNGKGTPICQLNGDLLSDTKAEPKLTFLVDNNCNFIGTALKDEWGDNYQSEVNNIMSYPTHHKCRNQFTLSQKAIMLYSASENKFGKYWTTDNSENLKYFFDKNEPDDYQEMAGIIETGTEQEHNFHKIFLKKDHDGLDTCDWVKFEVKSESLKNIKVTIIPDKDNQNNLKANLFDKNKIRLSTKSNNSPASNIELGYQNVVSDWYYINISPIDADKTEKINKYNIKVELY